MLESINYRGDKQRERMILDVMQRLKHIQNLQSYTIPPRNISYPQNVVKAPLDLKLIDMILYDLGNKHRMMSNDGYAHSKREIMRGFDSCLLNVKQGSDVSMSEQLMSDNWPAIGDLIANIIRCSGDF
jgi:hypothetical protein